MQACLAVVTGNLNPQQLPMVSLKGSKIYMNWSTAFGTYL